MHTFNKGFGLIEVVVAIAIIALLAGGGYYLAASGDRNVIEEGAMMEKEAEDVMKDIEAMMEEKNGMMEQGGAMMEENKAMEKGASQYQGTVLAGSIAPLLDFTKADYDAALASQKLVVLYFYANWCPICKAEVRNALYPAFNELQNSNVIGFQVNFNDNETDTDEEALARQFGVAYQHTKVFLKDGNRILKSPESWNKNRYATEITQAAN